MLLYPANGSRGAVEDVDVAKKRAGKAKKSPPKERADSGGLLRRHGREIAGLVVMAAAVLLSLALISYQPTDASLNTTSTEPVRNWIGLFGAVLADSLFQLLGVTSFITAGVALVFGARLMVRRRTPVRLAEVVGLLSLVVLVALLAQMIVGTVLFRGEPLSTGGALGRLLGDLCVGVLGRAGTIIVTLCGLLITLKLALDISIADVASLARGPLGRLGERGRDGTTAAASRAAASLRGLREGAAARLRDRKEARARRKAAREAEKAEAAADDISVEEELVAEAQSGIYEAVQSAAPRIVTSEDPEPPLESDEVESLEGLDAVESAELAEVGNAASAVAAEVTVEGLAPDPDAVETMLADGSEGPRIVESEHMQDRPEPEVDSLRGWATDVEFEVPPLSLLDPVSSSRSSFSEDELHRNARKLEAKLADYRVKGRVVEIHPGPVITMYEFEPAPGVKIASIAGLSNDLSMALKAESVRIVAPLPGKGVVGIEVPNRHRETVYLREVLAHDAKEIDKRKLPMAVGKDIVGKPDLADLAKMPHLLIAGTTGSGKSVAVNGMLVSLLLSRTPDEVRLILIDPKMIEFVVYEDIPHLLLPVVTDPREASSALRWAVMEMTRRYELLRMFKKRNLVGFNKQMVQLREQWEVSGDAVLPWDPEDADAPFNGPPEELPYIVIVIDELADLMMVARKDVEDSIVRLAQMARAAGIHLVLATQRPSVDVITGLIKANFPARMSFKVSSKVDSRTVLDNNGAESLLGAGDMLMLRPGTSSLQRFHSPLVTVDEINRVTDALREQAAPRYLDHVLDAATAAAEAGAEAEEYDEMYDRAVAVVAQHRKASTSMLQRHLKIGYNRAARIIDRLEEQGVIGPADGVKPREVFVQPIGPEA